VVSSFSTRFVFHISFYSFVTGWQAKAILPWKCTRPSCDTPSLLGYHDLGYEGFMISLVMSYLSCTTVHLNIHMYLR
jgi:hypothetical protein